VALGASSQAGLTQPASAGSLARTLGVTLRLSPKPPHSMRFDLRLPRPPRFPLRILVLCLLVVAGLPAKSAVIYLCRAYSGGEFWAAQRCHEHNAVAIRTVTVPEDMPFEQQVKLGEAALAESRRLVAPPRSQPPSPSKAERESRIAECRQLQAKVVQLDAWARQPQSAQTQDRIRAERSRVRARQFALGC